MQQTDTTNHIPQPPNIEPAANPEPPPLSIVDYLLVIVRHKKMILLTTVGVALLTALYTLTMPNIYTATTLILASEDDKGGMGAMMAQLGGLAGIAGGSLGGPTKTDLYVSMLKSETVKDPIIDRFKLLDVYKAKFRYDAYKALNTNTMISAGKKDGIITIAVSDKDPKLAAEIANGYVDELGKLAASLSMSGAGKNRLFLEERLATAKADLVKAGDELKNFQAKNKMLNVTEQAKASIEGVAQLRGQLAVQEVQLAGMLRQFTDSSQEVKRARVAVSNLRGQIARLEGGGGTSSIPSVGSVPQLGQDYLRLMRDAKIQETMVELLTKQYEMARLSESKDLSPFQVLQLAKIPEVKIKPFRSRTVISFTITSFLFAIIVAVASDKCNKISDETKVRLRELKNEFAFRSK